MPRFSDTWVVDRALFEYVNGGSCACCSAVGLFNPDGLKGLINAVTDLETDAANSELKAAEQSPWPPEFRDCVWGDRVRLRHKMKKEMVNYKEFCNTYDKEDLEAWLCNEEEFGAGKLKKLFQMPRSEVCEIIEHGYRIDTHFNTVMAAVVEQVQNFKATKYDIDSRGIYEIGFEKILSFDRRAGFVIPIATKNKVKSTSDNTVYEIKREVLSTFLDMMYSLGGPKLLARGPKSTNNEDEEDNGDVDGPEIDPEKTSGPSFRSDRRVIRLLIARYWADMIIKSYKKFKENVVT